MYDNIANSKRIPLRAVLIVPFVLQIFTAVGLTGYFSLQNGQKAVNDVSAQLRRETATRIEQNLRTYLATAHLVNQINADAVSLGQLNIEDLTGWERHIWLQKKRFNTVDGIVMINEKGKGIAIQSYDPGNLVIQVAGATKQNQLYMYLAGSQGERLKLIKMVENFDPRKTKSYKLSIKVSKTTWTIIHFSDLIPTPVIVASQPIFDKNKKVIAVLLTGLRLSLIGNFLQTLKVGKTGQTFIIEKSGMLVATSTSEKPYRNKQRFLAPDSKNILTKATANYLKTQFKDLNSIQSSQQLEFLINGQKQFVQVVPFQDGKGIDWLIVIAVPENDFMGQINRSRHTTILLCLLALFWATVLGIVTSEWIARPIRRLGKATSAIADGDFEQPVTTSTVQEVSTLATSFNLMSQQLKQSYEQLEDYSRSLEQKVAERTQELEQEIRDRKQTEIELHIAKETADAANTAKSEFLANMSHELRTPLNGILGYAQILMDSKNLDSQIVSSVKIIYQCGSHLLTLINDILDFSKIEARKMEFYPKPFHFWAFLEDISQIFRLSTEQKAISFTCQFDFSLPNNVQGDEKRLRQILINLLGNAIKFTDRGGVTFKVQLIKSVPLEPNPQELESINTIRFQVEDTGVGISKEQIQKIFQPFEQVGNTNKRSEGTGLGLAISLKIIEMMGGSIQVNSQLNAGSQFWFDLDLPSASKWELCSVELKTAIAGYEGNKLKILAVDDQWENRSVLVNLLAPLGFEVSEAVNAEEALEKINSVQFNAVITDLVMPKMNGFELVSRLRSQPELKDLVIIISSASVFEVEQYKSLDVGANAFLPKPVQADELFALLQKHLGISWAYQESSQLDKNVNQSVESDSVSSLVPPPDEELAILYDLVMIGNLKAVTKQLEQLKKLDVKYIPFAERAGELAGSFQEKKLRLFIKDYKPNNRNKIDT